MSALLKSGWTTFVAALAATILTAILTFTRTGAVVVFLMSAMALAILAMVVGQATEQLGNYMGPGATGLLQASIASMPELFVGFFALRAGLITVVQSAIVGSILANSLLVMGLAFLFGGWKNGTQRFASERPRAIVIMMVLAVSALVLPTIVDAVHTPAEAHEETLSIASALVLLVVFFASIPFSLKGGAVGEAVPSSELEEQHWSSRRAIFVLVTAGILIAFVSDWFVEALEPSIESWHISHAFAGLVIVAIAGNAVENVVGIQLAIKNKIDYAISIVMNSSLQVALALTPILVLLSYFFTPVELTLVLPPLLVVALALTAILSALIVYDGESNWLEGLALVGLYIMIAISFWWG
ncbi:MAG TPA: calcium/proton exchanger [Anaerolineales bacterium]|jgi:Ca2+:H+ antiporter|nr:calcium/proton exchanger [Anaerolineales bacterium]